MEAVEVVENFYGSIKIFHGCGGIFNVHECRSFRVKTSLQGSFYFRGAEFMLYRNPSTNQPTNQPTNTIGLKSNEITQPANEIDLVAERTNLKQEDAVDPKSRHKGKYESEAYLAEIGMPFTSIRPTYIYGPLNYNPLEEYFFERLDQDRTIIIPGELADY